MVEEQEPDARRPRADGRGLRWVWTVLFIVLTGSGGAATSVAGGELFSGRFWLIVTLYMLVAAGVGLGMGLLLRRSLGWRSSPWASRRKQLSWRQRWRIGWANERARAVEDPELAKAAVERGEFGLRAMARLRDWYTLTAKIVSGLMFVVAVFLLVLVLWDWQSEAGDWLGIGLVAFLVGLAVLLPWFQRRVWRWATRRAERALAANREVASRAGGADRTGG